MKTENETLKFVFITNCVNEDFYNPVKKGVHDASRLIDVKADFIGTEEVDIDQQIEMVDNAIKQGYDGIALSITHPTKFNAVIEKALKHGIPVVGFNIDSNDPSNKRLSCICQNVYEAGKILGREAMKYIPEKSRLLFTLHSVGVSALDDRLRGAQEVLSNKNIISQVVVTGIEPMKASSIILKALKEDEQINAIICTGQADTEGAGIAANILKKDKDYFVAGFDLSAKIIQFIEEGIIRFTIDQQPYVQGFYPVLQLALYCRYGIIPSNMDAGATIIDRNNIKTLIRAHQKGYR
ncbi:substrate-binding domain-containing protein [Moorella naiadis]|uniref:substrate-binding domain-containing protein n=1 Tax=Moorella naiadis (nom. illeg.) TaxID=3093670 RepID=UPI003D9CA3BA